MTAPEDTRERLAEALNAADNRSLLRGMLGGYSEGGYWRMLADALLPLIDTLLREQREGIAAAIEWEAGGREAQAFHARDEDVEFFGSKQRLSAETKALRDAARVARTFGGER